MFYVPCLTYCILRNEDSPTHLSSHFSPFLSVNHVLKDDLQVLTYINFPNQQYLLDHKSQ